MSQMAEFLAAAQEAHAAHFPATIVIDGETYADAATSGWSGRDPLALGGAPAERRTSFWLPRASFTAAAQPLPRAMRDTLEATAPADMASLFTIDEVLLDPTATTVTIRCTAQPQ